MMGTTDVERLCDRAIIIEDEENDQSLEKCNLQFKSPLFSLLPREIRDIIWGYATAQFEDKDHEYSANEYYCRPGHRARHKVPTQLLYTCRRVWLEANQLPMLQAEQCFWYHRPAPDKRDPAWTATLTEKNRRDFGHLHLFAQMFAIESLTRDKGKLRSYFLTTPERAGDFQPRMLHVTIRHTDWWSWESEAPLRFKDSWLQAMLDSPDLRSTETLKLELETLDYKVDQLMPIVDRLKGLVGKEYETHFVNGVPTNTKFLLSGEPETYDWSGPTDINGHTFRHYEGRPALNYHVVTLTWRLIFPEIPRAHIPELRRAPRIGAPEASPIPVKSRRVDATTLPSRPNASCIDGPEGVPSDDPGISRRARRRRRNKWNKLSEDVRTKQRDSHNLRDAERARAYLQALDQYHGEVGLALQRESFQQGMVSVHRRRQEAKCQAENSLLRFE